MMMARKFEETSEDTRQALAGFLHALDASALADKLLDFADRDHEIERELHQWRKASALSDEPADLEDLLSEMLSPGRGFISRPEGASYVRRAEAVLPLLQRAREQDAGAKPRMQCWLKGQSTPQSSPQERVAPRLPGCR